MHRYYGRYDDITLNACIAIWEGPIGYSTSCLHNFWQPMSVPYMLPTARVFCGGSHSSWKVISHKHPHFMDDFPISYHIHPHFMDHLAILGLPGCDGYHFQGLQGFQAPQRDSFRTRFQRLLGNSERSKRLGWSWGCHGIPWPKSWGKWWETMGSNGILDLFGRFAGSNFWDNPIFIWEGGWTLFFVADSRSQA